ncbi:unnamed protein product [Acanthoscelides obtectus]|uniref:Uncharacterized protein n=1 Tax=Acanthoscelides obtectus TaxID=200917 RepID=A0A9P0KQ19_ACAOB|nr:unnamed protein product [Acanthoscelides obtectus]CAK1682103.1 hypothetical protein AOBTE_LOCUS33427 [Acanthoscelides obtectus]
MSVFAFSFYQNINYITASIGIRNFIFQCNVKLATTKPFIGNIHSWPQLILPRWFIRDIPELYASRSLTSIYRVDIHNRFKWLYVRRPVNMEIQHHSSIQV